MNHYQWLVTVLRQDGALDLAAMSDTPYAGDLLLLEDGSIVTVVAMGIYQNQDQEYLAATAFVTPKKVHCLYRRNEIKDDGDVDCT